MRIWAGREGQLGASQLLVPNLQLISNETVGQPLTFQPQFPPTPTSHGCKDSMMQHFKIGAHFKPSGSRSCRHWGCYHSQILPLLPSKATSALTHSSRPNCRPSQLTLFRPLLIVTISDNPIILLSLPVSKLTPPATLLPSPALYFFSWH